MSDESKDNDDKRQHPEKKKNQLQKKFQEHRKEKLRNRQMERSRSRQRSLGISQFIAQPQSDQDEDEGTGSKSQFTKFFLRRRRQIQIKKQQQARRSQPQRVPLPLPPQREVSQERGPPKQADPQVRPKSQTETYLALLASLRERRQDKDTKIKGKNYDKAKQSRFTQRLKRFQRKRFESESQQLPADRILHPLPQRQNQSHVSPVVLPPPPPYYPEMIPLAESSSSGPGENSFLPDPDPEPLPLRMTKPEIRDRLDSQVVRLQEEHAQAIKKGDKQAILSAQMKLKKANQERFSVSKKISKARAQKIQRSGVKIIQPLPSQRRRQQRLNQVPIAPLPSPMPIPPIPVPPIPSSQVKKRSKSKPKEQTVSKQKRIKKPSKTQKQQKKNIIAQIASDRVSAQRPALQAQYEPLIRANQPRPPIIQQVPHPVFNVLPPPRLTDADLLAAAMRSPAVIRQAVQPAPSLIAPTIPPGLITLPPNMKKAIQQKARHQRSQAIQKAQREKKAQNLSQKRQHRIAIQRQRHQQRQGQRRRAAGEQRRMQLQQGQRAADRIQVIELCRNGVNDIVYNQKDGLSWIGVRITRGDHQYFTKNCIYMHHKFVRQIPRAFRALAERERPRGTVKQIQHLRGTDVIMIRDYYKGKQYMCLRMTRWSPEQERSFSTRNGFNLTPTQMLALIQRLQNQVFPLLN